jgi:hypothetical protein
MRKREEPVVKNRKVVFHDGAVISLHDKYGRLEVYFPYSFSCGCVYSNKLELAEAIKLIGNTEKEVTDNVSEEGL